MVSKALFLECYTDLLGDFNQSLKSERYMKTAYSYFCQRLTDEEFELAVRRAMISCCFFPTPQQLVELVKGSQQVKAAEEWEQVIDAASRGLRLAETELSDSTKAAVQSIGGLNKIGMATESQLVWLRKEFVDLWQCYESCPKPMLPESRNNKIPEFTLKTIGGEP